MLSFDCCVHLDQATDVRNFHVNWDGCSFIYPLQVRSVTAFTWPDLTEPSIGVWVTTGYKGELLEQRPFVQFYN